jgi:hypothetical protein
MNSHVMDFQECSSCGKKRTEFINSLLFLIVTEYKQLHRNRYISMSITEEEAPMSPINQGLAGRRVL